MNSPSILAAVPKTPLRLALEHAVVADGSQPHPTTEAVIADEGWRPLSGRIKKRGEVVEAGL